MEKLPRAPRRSSTPRLISRLRQIRPRANFRPLTSTEHLILGLTVPFPEDIDGRTQIAMLRSFDEEMAPFRQLERVLILLNIGALLGLGDRRSVRRARGDPASYQSLGRGAERSCAATIARGCR